MRNLLFVFCCVLFSSNGVLGQFVEKQLIAPELPSGQDRILADMDGDGDKDVLMIGKNNNMILWIENEGMGKLGRNHIIDNQASRVTNIDIGDFNGDGFIDIVANLSADNTVQWYAGSESGIFALKRILCHANCEDLNIVNTGDFDGDGDIDIVVGQNKRLFGFINNGTGEFSDPIFILSSGTTIQYAQTIDIDGNGKDDLYYGAYGNKRNYLISNLLEEQLEEIQEFLSSFGEHAQFKDMDQDGDLDLFLEDYETLRWYANNGNGTIDFNNYQQIAEEGLSHSFEHMGVIDIDTDGYMDVFWIEKTLAPEQPSKFQWSRNLGNGIFEIQDIQYLEDGYYFGSYPTVQSFDFNEDGHQDLVLGDMWFENQATQFDIRKPNFISHYLREIKQTDLADMNGDERLDLIALGKDFLVWIEAKPDGTFGIMHLLETSQYTNDAKGFIIHDINQDGRSDLVCWFAENHGINIFLQQEGGNFEFIDVANSKSYPQKVFMIDMDEDSDLDMLVVAGLYYGLWMHTNNGNNTFNNHPKRIAESSAPNAIIQDFNQDGKLDVVSLSTGKIFWSEQDEDGIFSIEHSIDVPEIDNYFSDSHIEIADLDQDGRLDIIYADDNKLGWLRTTGDETYEHDRIDWTVYDTFGLIVRDLDKDGDMDIRLFTDDTPVLHYINQGNEYFFEEKIFHNSGEEVSLQMLDLDGDSDEDIIVAHSSKITYFESIKSEAQIHCTAFFDENENGVMDEGEQPILNQAITLSPNDFQAFTDETGKIIFHTNPGTYELGYIPNPLWKLTTEEDSYSILIDENYEITHYFFGFTPTRITHRVQPNLTSVRTRCSETVPFWLNYVNTGTTRANGHISLDADSLLNFISAEPTPDYEEDGKLFWEINDLYPFEERRIELRYQIPSSQFVGRELQLQARVELFNQNEQLVHFKNTDYTPIVRCSFDPNDKLAQTEQYGNQELVWKQDSLYYTVRFQNTGNDFARDVRITDFLDKNLDWTTFSPLTSSHDMETTLDRNTGEITFLFEDILLPDSTTNEPESHGFVTYSIAPISNIEDKTEINNTAFIYFDFNTPIITNTTSHITTDDPATSITTHQPQLYLNIYPNPTKDHWHIHLQYPTNQNYQLKLLDVTGKLLQSYTDLQNGTNLIERKGLQSGVYFLQLEGEDGKVLGMGKLLVE